MVLSSILAAQTDAPTKSKASPVVIEQAAIRALNFEQGAADSLNKSRSDFTPHGWEEFMKTMQGFLDAKGAPTFTCKFVPASTSVSTEEANDGFQLKVPGTLTQSSAGSKTTYRLRLEVRASGNPPKIEHLEQVTCDKEHAANYCM